MTIDEIAKKWCLYMPSSNTRNAMQEYADQETERLKAELVKTIETAKATSVTQRQHIERLQNELNELKEKHKSDVINAIASCLYEAGDDDLEQVFHYKKAEQYYKQKFELNGK